MSGREESTEVNECKWLPSNRSLSQPSPPLLHCPMEGQIMSWPFHCAEAMIVSLALIYLTVKDSGQRFGLKNLFLWMTLIAVAVATAAAPIRFPVE
jgi:hypothetical protein